MTTARKPKVAPKDEFEISLDQMLSTYRAAVLAYRASSASEKKLGRFRDPTVPIRAAGDVVLELQPDLGTIEAQRMAERAIAWAKQAALPGFWN
jgi:hypothetical protein